MASVMAIPGNEPLQCRIAEAASRGTLSHAVILSGAGDLAAAARYTAAAMQCTGDTPPCGRCPACDKVLRGIHPDVTVVVDEEHKNISLDVLRTVRADAYVIPNEGNRRVFIFPDCEKLDPKSQNVLLKVVEEGPPHAAFIFCAANSASLLQTIRSRSVEWKLMPAPRRAEIAVDARRLCILMGERKTSEIVSLCCELENRKVSREELQAILSDARDLLTSALAATYGTPAADPDVSRLAREMGRRRLTSAIEVFQRFIRECGYNIGVGHLTGALSVALEL